MRRGSNPSAFTLVELLVVIGVIALLIGILIPVLITAKEKANRLRCSSNLRQIGQGQFTYAADYKNQYPRFFFEGRGRSAGYFYLFPENIVNGWQNYPNDVTAGIFLMVRYRILTLDVFLCPSSNQQRDFVIGGTPGNVIEIPPTERSNFSDQKPFSWSVSYCFANQYPPLSDVDYPEEANFRHSPSAPAANAIAADRNDGIDRWKNLSPNAPKSDMELMNSRNHGGKGQNVLFNDGSVRWCDNPFVGYNRDNIYTRANSPPNNSHVPNGRYDSNLGPQLPLTSHVH